jgi:hypothetical protein
VSFLRGISSGERLVIGGRVAIYGGGDKAVAAYEMLVHAHA